MCLYVHGYVSKQREARAQTTAVILIAVPITGGMGSSSAKLSTSQE